ncbi:AI-2E family transporter [Methyloligella sp. 2.7D]|uniref:AI-2E family transporter n=1 Tax=unclassified Methyloligella TaxID=2625955 RepID=UPI00157D980A|nr:AI-2E family transporter [Methyloligella sp. GL2]QKP76166.1 AI-2E family transporter [Methyloligella sp. GL2]
MATSASKDNTQLEEELRERPVMRSAMLATLGVCIVLALASVAWFARIPILLAFAGILLAIVLHGGSRAIYDLTGVPQLVALAGLIIVLFLFLVAVIVGAGPTLVTQATELVRGLGSGLTNLSSQVFDLQEGETLFKNFNLVDFLSNMQPWGIASGATVFASNVIGVLASGMIVLFFGIYIAADPDTHIKLAVKLAPPKDQPAMKKLLKETGSVLRRWLIGQGISMTVIGVLTYIGLMILGVPIAFTLALFAALAGFLPYLGPIIGAVPMVLVAGGTSLELASYVLILYVVVQSIESYLLTPLIQSKAVYLPPAVVILSQLVMGAVFGILGIALATPLAAAVSIPLRHWFGGDEPETISDK